MMPSHRYSVEAHVNARLQQTLPSDILVSVQLLRLPVSTYFSRNTSRLGPSLGSTGVAAVHVGAGGGRRGLPRVEGHDLALVLEVDGHEEAAPDAHAVRVDESVAEERCDGRVHRRAISLQHVTAMREV